MNFKKLGTIALAASIALGSAGILSANAQTNYTKERIGVMKQIGGAMQAGNLDAAKEGFVTLATLWPADSMGAYRAKAEIWNADGSLNAEVVAIMDNGANAAAIDEASKACGACHKAFRGPKP